MKYANDDRFLKGILKVLTTHSNIFVENLKTKIIDFKLNHMRDPQSLNTNYITRLVSFILKKFSIQT